MYRWVFGVAVVETEEIKCLSMYFAWFVRGPFCCGAAEGKGTKDANRYYDSAPATVLH